MDNFNNIPAEKFRFATKTDLYHDSKFETKPVSYFQGAFRRFAKNKGAVVGGIGSGIGYAADMSLMERGLQEQRQFSIDKFRMQLGNIQALPYTLTKVGAFNINSKVFPFLEYYTCSEQEKEALKMKIQYEGMTVGVVDILGNYMSGGYVQADLIRNESIIEDSHLLDDIYIELTKGVYM
jgi:hypothetical protein